MTEKTCDEVRDEFLSHVRSLCAYWENADERTLREKLDGLAFSILSAIDGSAASLPAFILAPCPHEDDKEFLESQGKDHYPENHKVEELIKCDIGGSLHELFYQRQ